ncbi:hypothetical protein [Nonomuraea sediminis]|uniref:hypothetical protein n=1 Tax=Nonomuraea sediminis TaxID=2835864 RepID=UPI001BDD6B66|nr:hypothetical protein [Nonomuraea sediminis]
MRVRELLDDGLPANVGVGIGGAPADATPPYVALYFPLGDESDADRALNDDVATDVLFQATTVAASPEQALLVAGKAATLLRTMDASLPDRRVRPILQDGSQPVGRDDTSVPVWFVTAQYLARCDPA